MPTKRETFKFKGILPADRNLNREAGEAWVTITISDNLVRDGRENLANSLKRKLQDVCTVPMVIEGETVPETPAVPQDFSTFPDDGAIRVNRSGIQIIMGKSEGYNEISWWVIKDDLYHPTLGSREQQFGRGSFFAKIVNGELVHTSSRIDLLPESEKLQVNMLIAEARSRGRTGDFTRSQWDNWWAARWRLPLDIYV